MLKVLWIEDDMANIEEYIDESFDDFFGEPIVPVSFKESFEFTEDNLAYDLVVIDIDLHKFNDFNSPYVEEIKKQIQFEPKQAGIVLFIKLLEQGFPKDRVLFLTGNAGSEYNTYDLFQGYFTKALMTFPDYIFKDGNAPDKLSKNLESRQTQYLMLRRGIIEGCNFLKKHIMKDDANIQFRDFINSKDYELTITDIKNYLDTLEQFLSVKEAKQPLILQMQYRLFLRALAHVWENNVKAESLEKKHAGNLDKIHDLYTFGWLMKITRNWVSHANLLEPLNPQFLAFLFLINMRAMFKLPKAIQSYESILLNCISQKPIEKIKAETLNQKIKDAEANINGILDCISINEKGHFGKKINALYQYNTGQPDAEEHNFICFLFQYFWINQNNPAYLKNLRIDSEEFLPTLARCIYKSSFKNL